MEIAKKVWTKPEVEELSVNRGTEHGSLSGVDGGITSASGS